MPCDCVEDVDLNIFRGVFIEQWLKGQKHEGCQEALFFCTSCGPPAVQESMKASHGGSSGASRRVHPAASDGRSTDKKSPNGKSSLSNTLKRFFSSSKNSSKSDVGTPMSKQQSSLARDPSTRVMAAEEEELPTTPRTEKELYLCVTCGACYCRDHACDHHYSRRESNGGDEADVAVMQYPYHSFFIGVPSFVSTHPSHLMHETSWGLLFPTVIVREIEEGTVDLTKPLPFYENFPEICDANAACGLSTSWFNAGASVNSSNGFVQKINTLSGASSGAHTRVHSAVGSSGHLDGTPSIYQKTTNHVDAMEGCSQGPGDLLLASGRVTGGALSVPEFHSYPADNWSYLMFCAKCGDRQAVRLQGKQYDNDLSTACCLRRLGQLTALLAYFFFAGVKLELPKQFLEYTARKRAQQVERQRLRQRAYRSTEMQRVGRSSEHVGRFDASLPAVNYQGSSADISAVTAHVSNGCGVLSRTETDHVLTRAAICGFSNSSYFCYMNSVLQCVLRCRNFSHSLLNYNHTRGPGKLTTSMMCLLHHIAHQTYQDVRNGAVFAFVRSVRAQICRINSLFEEDEQQDAQEFLITLLNGIADEFDKGRSEEHKKANRYVSFEGALLSEVTCLQCRHCVPRNEMFMSLSIPIEESIEAGVASLFAPTTLRGKDRYACEGCFKKLSKKAQEAHNALATAQAEQEKRAKEDGKKVALDPKEERVYPNSIYSEAEVRASFSHLGGSLAVHLLRFHYDADAQSFIKVLRPVRISLQLDLTPYASRGVIEAYNHRDAMHVLQRRFPEAPAKLLESYLRDAKDDINIATRRMLDDGQGLSGEHSLRVSGSSAARGVDGVVCREDGPYAADEVSEDVVGVGSALNDLAGSMSSSIATGLNSTLNGTVSKVSVMKSSRSADRAGGGAQLSPAESAVLTPTSVMAISRDEFDPFGERDPPRQRLVRHLVGIVAHRGSLHGGHYIAYVRHATRPHIWFRCDDEDIDVVEEKYVLEHEAEVYLAFYE